MCGPMCSAAITKVQEQERTVRNALVDHASSWLCRRLISVTKCESQRKCRALHKCAVLGVVSWFLGVLRQTWIDVSVR